MLNPRSLLPLAALVLGCDATQAGVPNPPGFPHAFAYASCAPWDGPATIVVLTADSLDLSGPLEPIGAAISVSVWKPVDALSGESFDLTPGANLGAATHCPGDAAPCEAATSARVRFRHIGADRLVQGTLNLTLPGVRHISGGFRATWVERVVWCG